MFIQNSSDVKQLLSSRHLEFDNDDDDTINWDGSAAVDSKIGTLIEHFLDNSCIAKLHLSRSVLLFENFR